MAGADRHDNTERWVAHARAANNDPDLAEELTEHGRRSSVGGPIELPGGMAVRDSKDPDGPRLRFDADAWNAFVGSLRP